jgi:hypothetical protein
VGGRQGAIVEEKIKEAIETAIAISKRHSVFSNDRDNLVRRATLQNNFRAEAT